MLRPGLHPEPGRADSRWREGTGRRFAESPPPPAPPWTWTLGGVEKHVLPSAFFSKTHPHPKSRAIPEVTVTTTGTTLNRLDIC